MAEEQGFKQSLVHKVLGGEIIKEIKRVNRYKEKSDQFALSHRDNLRPHGVELQVSKWK
jgi:hypothetical protein